MERCKITLSDKNLKRPAVAVALLLLAALFAGELAVAFMARDYKKDMIGHDYAVAGYLARHGVDSSIVAAAFTSVKDAADMENGASLLSVSGYDEQVQNSLLPEVRRFHQKYGLIALTAGLLFSAAFLAVLYLGELRRNGQIEAASDKLRNFLDGDTAIRLADYGEGSLFKLFAMVNTMATSLTAHVEKEKQNKEFLKETISDISHQLKTPLAALSMYNEIIREEKTSNEVVESFAEKSSRELNRMESLIQNLLKLARLDAGAMELEKSFQPVRTFLEECAAPFATRAGQEGKKLRLDCDASIQMPFDETWLGEAVGNIIKNALDHTSGGDQIGIFCTETAVAIEIIIKDSGSGIHPEDIHHIFKRFYRSRYSKDKQGVGIGLALSKTVVEKHGGTITVSSELGHGVQFCLIFPKLTNT